MYDELKAQVLARIQGRDLIGLLEQLGLHPRDEGGGEVAILCPFHDDHNPSFKINVEKVPQPFKCFSCGWGGDVFKFVQQLRGLRTWLETAEYMAELLGLRPGSRRSAPDPRTKGSHPRPAAQPARAARSEEAERKRAENIEKARLLWEQARPDHPRIAAYFRARGIPVERLPNGQLPACFRFHPEVWQGFAPEKNAPSRSVCTPAIVSQVDEYLPSDTAKGWARQLSGVHLTCLDDRADRKVDASRAKQKFMLGACAGRAIWLRQTFCRGGLILGEGIETTLACSIAADLGALVCMDAGKLQAVKLPTRLMQPGSMANIGTVIIAADFDQGRLAGKHRLGHIEGLRAKMPYLTPEQLEEIADKPTGERSAWTLKRRIEHDIPCVTVLVRAPGPESCPQAFDWAPGIPVEAGGTGKPIPRLKPTLKKLDWLDVANLAGYDAVRTALLDGVDFEANRARAAAWLPPPGWDWDRQQSVAPTRAMAASGGSGGSGSVFRQEQEGGGDGGEPPASGGGGNGPDAGGYVEMGDGSRRRLMSIEDLTLARQFVDEHYAPAEDRRERANSRFHLVALVAEKSDRGRGFQRFNGSAWEALDDAVVEGQIRQWLTPCARAKVRDGEVEYVPYNPALTKVRAIKHAVADEVLVTAEESRFWMRPTYGDTGRATWETPAWRQAIEDPVASGRLDPSQVLSFQDYQVSIPALLERRVEAWRPTPLLYQQTVFPYQLPIEALRHAVEAPLDERWDRWIEIYERLCPAWMQFLRGLDWSLEELEFLRCWTGYAQLFDTSVKNANILFMHGPGDAGKGTTEEAIMLAVGVKNVVKTSPGELPDKFHRASFRHKLLAAISEAEVGKFTDNTEALRVLKTLGSGDTISTRDLWQRERPNERLFTRFLISCNEMIDIKDRSGQWLNRVAVLDFRKSYTGRIDPGIKRAVMGEGVGLVMWGLSGMIDLLSARARGIHVLRQPTASSTPLTIYAEYAAPLQNFVDEWLELKLSEEVVSEDGSVQTREPFLLSAELHRAYCVAMGLGPPDPRKAASVNKAILSALRAKGWRGTYSQPRDATGRRESGYTQLALSDLARVRLAAPPATGGQGPPAAMF